ncbi:Uncharacterised protein [Yersinia mollaretii]|uniref:Uncharacterized protein n=2 Tax=Yersinia mollaretii TaxID=33060 RepID=A0AA36PMW8_YERMO|nr:Uncharacterised protein [Yersinia mollaretii]
MAISYEDIKRQRIKLEDKRQVRRTQLQKDIGNLMESYRASLNFEYPQWFDKNDTPRPYVTLGLINANNLYEKTSIASLRLDKDNKISFFISTVVNDSPTSGDHYLVSVTVHYDSGVLIASIGDEGHKIYVADPESEDGLSEVIEGIKQLIITGLTDHSLD